MHPPSLFTPLLFCTSNGVCAAERKTQGKLDADAHVRPSRVDGDSEGRGAESKGRRRGEKDEREPVPAATRAARDCNISKISDKIKTAISGTLVLLLKHLQTTCTSLST